MSSTTATSDGHLFAERDEAFALIDALASASSPSSLLPPPPAVGAAGALVAAPPPPSRPDAALARLRAVLDRYLECPTLLDPSLAALVGRLSGPARGIVRALFAPRPGGVGGVAAPAAEDAEETGRAGAGAPPPPEETADARVPTLMRLLSALGALSKVRGRKRVQRLLPAEVADVEPVLAALRWFGRRERRRRDAAVFGGGSAGSAEEAAPAWESVHSLLTWLGIVVLVPFDLRTIDSSWEPPPHEFAAARDDGAAAAAAGARGPPATAAAGVHNETTLVRSILATAASHLTDHGSGRDAAAACLAALLSRPDLARERASSLEGVAAWSAEVLRRFREEGEGASREEGAAGGGSDNVHDNNKNHGDDVNNGSNGNDTSNDSGTSNSSNIINENNSNGNNNKEGDDDNDRVLPPLPLPTGPPSIFLVMGVLQTLAAMFKTGHRASLLRHPHDVEALWEQALLLADDGAARGSVLLRKLLAKLFARMGCARLPPRVAAWRYRRGKRSLVENLRRGSGGETKEAEPKDDDEADVPPEDRLFPIPDQAEDAMDQLLRALADPATVVRWSAAKGVGRLAERLPAPCADDVLDAVFEMCAADHANDRAWHGACLALAELGRRGLLLPGRLGEATRLAARAMGYDVRRGRHSVGAHVRDAGECVVVALFVLPRKCSTVSAAAMLRRL